MSHARHAGRPPLLDVFWGEPQIEIPKQPSNQQHQSIITPQWFVEALGAGRKR
jgi:hypothetical protein